MIPLFLPPGTTPGLGKPKQNLYSSAPAGMYLQLYFRSVTNLSDARFASAVGAEFVGFPMQSPGHAGISGDDYLEISQWISGPVPVKQLASALPETESSSNGGIPGDSPTEAVELLWSPPNNLHLSQHPGCPVIWVLNPRAPQLPAFFRQESDFLLADLLNMPQEAGQSKMDGDELQPWIDISRSYRCFLEVTPPFEKIRNQVKRIKPFGLSLSGHPESMLGKRDYSDWQQLIEELEQTGLR